MADGVSQDTYPANTTTILVLPDFPAPDSGAGQRSLLLLDGAAALGQVHVVVLSDQMPGDAVARLPQAASVAGWGRGTLKLGGMMRHVPHGALRLLAPDQLYRPDPVLRARLDDLIARTGAKAVVFRYFRTFCAAGMASRDDLAVLVDIDDRDDQKYATRLMRMFGERLGGSGALRFPVRRLGRMMQRRLADASLIWFAGAEDAWTLPKVRTAILPNVPMIAPAGKDMPPPSQGDAVLFVGISSHIPNQDGIRWFLDHCWADLAREFPAIRLRIVGRGRHWPELAARYPGLDRVDFAGHVEDLASEYARARLCICPVREGGGSKIKVIEAAGFGRPIVGVPHAFRGFEAGIRDHAAEALSPKDFVAACSVFLGNGDRADQAGAALAEWQKRRYSRDAALAQIRADIAGAASQGSTDPFTPDAGTNG